MSEGSGERRSLFRNLSPLDHRYYLENREPFDRLADFLSEEAAVRYYARVEAALLRRLIRVLPAAHTAPIDRPAVERALDAAVEAIDPAEVQAEEEITRHNLRAVVRVLQRRLPAPVRHLVHLGATSFDIQDTATALRIGGAVRAVALPLLLELADRLADVAEQEAATLQVGRTHGQHAVPITFGFAVASFVARLDDVLPRILDAADRLPGKLSGAVGAYNATALLVADPIDLERRVLADLGLAPAAHATQIVPAEPLVRLLLEINLAFGVLANLADDLRNLQRTEIAEVAESFGAAQVGSSTMPQKRNPWNSEHVKSLWKTFSPRAATFFMDQISEHQRDLTNSASARFAGEYLAGFTAAVNRTLRVVGSLRVDRARMAAAVRGSGDAVAAEAAYVVLARAGVADAHEVIRQAAAAARAGGETLAAALRRDAARWALLEGAAPDGSCAAPGGPSAADLLRDPGRYCGRAAERARAVAAMHRERSAALRRALADRTG